MTNLMGNLYERIFRTVELEKPEVNAFPALNPQIVTKTWGGRYEPLMEEFWMQYQEKVYYKMIQQIYKKDPTQNSLYFGLSQSPNMSVGVGIKIKSSSEDLKLIFQGTQKDPQIRRLEKELRRICAATEIKLN